ncbi:MAG: hypothetical protein WBS20_10075, partial [Lysobacterales bacterium]
MKRFSSITILILCLASVGVALAQVAPGSLVGSFQVSDGPDWTTNPPTYSCLEACAEVFGGAAGDYSCSTSAQSIDYMAFADGWGDTQYCSNPVSEDFKLNTLYDCGTTGCSYSAYVSDHGCDAVNYCYSSAPIPKVPVMNNIGMIILSLVLLLSGISF